MLAKMAAFSLEVSGEPWRHHHTPLERAVVQPSVMIMWAWLKTNASSATPRPLQLFSGLRPPPVVLHPATRPSRPILLVMDVAFPRHAGMACSH